MKGTAMAGRELRVATRTRGNLVVLDLDGDIDRDAAAPLRRAYDHAVGDGAARLLLNFAGVGYINSTGIAVIVDLLGQARADGHSVLATGLSDHYRRVFMVTRLSDFIVLQPNEDSAVTDAAPQQTSPDLQATKEVPR
jgi:anti-anti-sigma factor